MKVTTIDDQWNDSDHDSDRGSLTVYPLDANKRPIGFAREWPEPKKRKRKKKRRKKANP